MTSDFLHTLLANVWSILLVALFFGGSIFVHELGHFLAARWRGVKVERFSIGFGPAIVSWHGRDGVEYRLAWIPLGGYVLLPQLADLGPIEGESEVEVEKLPPVSYASKMIVFVAGALFNVLFAFGLASIIWVIGQPEPNDSATTRIGYVHRTLELPDGSSVPSPAAQAGLKAGDVIRAIDGHPVAGLGGYLSSRRPRRRPREIRWPPPRGVFDIERTGRKMEITVCIPAHRAKNRNARSVCEPAEL